MKVSRMRADGDVFVPDEIRAGKFVLGDPKFGIRKHHAKHKVFADTLEDAINLVESRGFSLWMKGRRSKQINLISPDEIRIVR